MTTKQRAIKLLKQALPYVMGYGNANCDCETTKYECRQWIEDQENLLRDLEENKT